MWHRSTSFACGLAFCSLLGQTLLAQGEEIDPGSLVRRTNWVQLEVVLGRIVAVNAAPQRRSHSTLNPLTGLGESLTVHTTSGAPSVSYECVTERELLKVDIVDGNEIIISRTARSESKLKVVPVSFHQPARGAVSLIVGAGQERQNYSSVSLWHLLLTDSVVCRESLLPILDALRPSWRLLETSEEIEEALFRVAGLDLPSRDQLVVLVKQLGSGSFQKRQAAERQLRAFGATTISFLTNLEGLDIDAEQRLRLNRVLRDLSVQSGDSAERVAAWLCDDRQIWLTMMNRGDLPDRQAAAQQLAKICRQPVQFDAAAEQAERLAQIARIRSEITRK